MKLYTVICNAKMYKGRRLAFRSTNLDDWEVFLFKENKSLTKVNLSFTEGKFAHPAVFVTSKEYR